MDDRLIEALDSVTWYNGLAEHIVEWKEDGYFKNSGDSLFWDWDKFDRLSAEAQNQLQIIWMICVELFGECGTSPRTGWILAENKESFFQFIDDITKTYRDDIESKRGDDMNGRQAAQAAAKRIEEMDVVISMQARDIRDYNSVILDMISGESPCAYCEDYEECQREVKAGKGCSEWWLRYPKEKEGANESERVLPEGVESGKGTETDPCTDQTL